MRRLGNVRRYNRRKKGTAAPTLGGVVVSESSFVIRN